MPPSDNLIGALRQAHWAIARAADHLWRREGCSPAYRDAAHARDGSRDALARASVPETVLPHRTTHTMTKATRFIELTNWRTGELIYLDPSTIISIQQIAADSGGTRRTCIKATNNQLFLVQEETTSVYSAVMHMLDGLGTPSA